MASSEILLKRALRHDGAPRHGDLAELRAALNHWFDADFSVMSVATAEFVHKGNPRLGNDSGARAEVCRELINRGRPAIIAEEEPVVLLALPAPGEGDTAPWAALSPFVVREAEPEVVARAVAKITGCSFLTAKDWAQRQTIWSAERLIAVAELAVGRLASQAQMEAMQGEIEALSDHLLGTYEEISLLHRLSQNLKLTGSNEDLGRLAIQWLSEAIQAECIALLLLPEEKDKEAAAAAAELAPVFLKNGECSVDAAGFARLIEMLGVSKQPRPAVVNLDLRRCSRWPLPEVRQAVIVPMIEGGCLLGWLGALNHSGNGEFGSTEANLLSSVAAILAIHAGNVELYRQQGEFLAGVVRALTSAIDAKDPYTCGHSDRVARVAVRLANHLGCSMHDLETIYLSGLLHDIGKIGIDDQVLRKPGKLTEAEYEHIKLHAEIGYRILKDIKQLDQVLPVVRHHHEAWNGKGYPFGLSGDEIPYFARIVSVADAFDAMSSDRPYRKGIPDEQLEAILREGAGKQWDAQVVDAFFAIREEIREIMHMEPEVRAIKLMHDVVVPGETNLAFQIVPSSMPSTS